jgi:hypothetical protein
MAKNIDAYSPQVSKWRSVLYTFSFDLNVLASEPHNLFIGYLERESIVQPI